MHTCESNSKNVQKANTPRVSGPQRVLTGPTCQEVEMAKTRICTIDGCCKTAEKRVQVHRVLRRKRWGWLQ